MGYILERNFPINIPFSIKAFYFVKVGQCSEDLNMSWVKNFKISVKIHYQVQNMTQWLANSTSSANLASPLQYQHIIPPISNKAAVTAAKVTPKVALILLPGPKIKTRYEHLSYTFMGLPSKCWLLRGVCVVLYNFVMFTLQCTFTN